VCCSVVQCVAVWCSVLQCGAVWCSVVQCVAQQSVRFPQDNLSHFVFWNLEFLQKILELRLSPDIPIQID